MHDCGKLYFVAVFAEMSYLIKRIHAVPDFVCDGLLGTFAVEAMTSIRPRTLRGLPSTATKKDPRRTHRVVSQYMPIKFGEHPDLEARQEISGAAECRGQAVVVRNAGLLGTSVDGLHTSALAPYLYGYNYEWHHESTGRLVVTRRRSRPTAGATRNPVGFFDLPDAENVSAVLFSDSGTIFKVQPDGASRRFRLEASCAYESGTAYNHGSRFGRTDRVRADRRVPGYRETWGEGSMSSTIRGGPSTRSRDVAGSGAPSTPGRADGERDAGVASVRVDHPGVGGDSEEGARRLMQVL